MVVDYANFHKRADRTKYIFEKFRKYFGGNLPGRWLRRSDTENPAAPDTKYTGIDVAGKPDIVSTSKRLSGCLLIIPPSIVSSVQMSLSIWTISILCFPS